jgi:metal-responsive CopG/Arc/MetJ family transcriptional regulator
MKKQKKHYTFKIELDLLEEIEKVCKKNPFIIRSGLINEAIKEYLKNNKHKF